METTENEQAADRFIPWAAIAVLLLAALLYELIQYTYVRTWENGWQLLYEIPFLVILGFAVYWTTRRVLQLQRERRWLANRLSAAEQQAREAGERLAAIFRLRQQFLDADDENEIISSVLPLSVTWSGASGASLVPLDEHGQPMVAVRHGEVPPDFSAAWVEYLASPAIRARCSVCQERDRLTTVCPLLKGPFTETSGMYCLPLRRGEREYGVLNLYISDPNLLTDERRAFLQSLINETALALESIWLRKRELGALRQLQAVRQKTDLSNWFADFLENLTQALDADFALLVNLDPDDSGESASSPSPGEEWIHGELPANSRPFISGILQGVLASGIPVALGNVHAEPGDPTSPVGLKAVLAAPLLSRDQSPLGVLLVGNRRARSFHPRHMTLLQTVATQIALVLENARQLAALEYQTLIAERTRLAREIHDGLAQTLGFLKLQVAQMQTYLERSDFQRLQASLRTYYQTLAEAYQEARNAIDGLRISPTQGGLQEWLPQMLAEFQENAGPQLQVSLSNLDVGEQGIAPAELPPEVQAQLIRILQEALSNVRKHAEAKHVWVSCLRQDDVLILEIRDDGRGFSPEDVPDSARHGLRGMRERIDLIGADFQVISFPLKGTTIRVCLPLKRRERIA